MPHTCFCPAASFLSFENTLLKRNYFPRRFSEGNWHLLKCTRCVQSKEHWQQHLSLPCLLHHTKLSCHPVMSCCKPKLCSRSSLFCWQIMYEEGEMQLEGIYNRECICCHTAAGLLRFHHPACLTNIQFSVPPFVLCWTIFSVSNSVLQFTV